MDFLKDLFEDKPLTLDDFQKRVEEKGLKLADLSSGKYVDQEKFKAEVGKVKNEYSTLKQKYESLAGAVDGDDGLKKQIESLQSEKTEFETKYSEAERKLNHMQNSQKVVKSGVSAEMADFVTYEVAKQANESVDFDTALKKFIDKNPQYVAEQKRVRTAPRLGGGESTGNNANSRMNEALLKASGRK